MYTSCNWSHGWDCHCLWSASSSASPHFTWCDLSRAHATPSTCTSASASSSPTPCSSWASPALRIRYVIFVACGFARVHSSDHKHAVCSLPVLMLWFRWAALLLRVFCTISSWLRSAGCVWKECSSSAWWCWSSTQRWDPSIWLPLVMEFLLLSLQFQPQRIQVDMALIASEF